MDSCWGNRIVTHRRDRGKAPDLSHSHRKADNSEVGWKQLTHLVLCDGNRVGGRIKTLRNWNPGCDPILLFIVIITVDYQSS